MYAFKRFADWGMCKWRSFSVWDVAIFKSCIFLLGLLAGSYFSQSLKKLRPILWCVTIASYGYLIWRMVVKDEA